MLEHTSRLAEKLATSVSRRDFLGSVGRWAGATALAMAGVLATAGSARAGSGKTCCRYYYFGGTNGDKLCGTACVPLGNPCPAPPPSCRNVSVNGIYTATVALCSRCK